MTHLRTGRKVGLHLYEQQGDSPADSDPPVGTVFTEELAATIVSAVNAQHDRENGGYDPRTEVNAHWNGDREALIAAWEHDQQHRIRHTEHCVTRDAERARIRDAILTEIEDMGPDGAMREYLADITRDGDPGHPGNSWWRAYCHVGGLMVALACTEPEGDAQ